MRDICDIIKRIIEKIPEDFVNRDNMVSRLESVRGSALYTAPEIMSIRWKDVSEILQNYLGAPDIEWKMEIGHIFTGDGE